MDQPIDVSSVASDDLNRIIKGQPINHPLSLNLTFDQRIALESLALLRAIKGGITFFVILTIIGIVVAFIK